MRAADLVGRVQRALPAPHQVQGGAAPVGPLVLVLGADHRHLVEPVGGQHRRRTAEHRRHHRAGQVHGLAGLGAIVQADHPVHPATPGGGAGVGVLDLLHRGEVRPVRHREADGVHGGELTRGERPLQRLHRRVQAERRVLGEQRAAGTGDRRARGVVARVAVRHHDAEAVDPAAQADHHQDVAACRGRERGLPERVAEDRGGDTGADARGDALEEAAPADLGGPGEVAAAGAVGHRVTVAVVGESRSTPTRRTNSQPLIAWSLVTLVAGGSPTAVTAAVSIRESEGRPSIIRLRWSTYLSRRIDRSGSQLAGFR